MIKFLNLQKHNTSYTDEILDAFRQIMNSGVYLRGQFTTDFEREFSVFCDVKHTIAVSNGLDALKLIFRGLLALKRLKKGDEVLIPANTFIASALAVSDCGLTPKFIDVDSASLLMHPDILLKYINQRTRVLLPVHLYGRICDMEKICSIAEAHNLIVVEDAAQAHGATLKNKKAGSFGHAAAFSFYPGKNLGAFGDAGAITTNDTELNDIVRNLANYGASQKYIHSHQGHNCRMDEIQAAILSIKLKNYSEEINRRREIAEFYNTHLISSYVSLPEAPPFEQHVWHLYVVRTQKRNEFIKYMHTNGIECLIHYPIPVHKQAAYSGFNEMKINSVETAAGQIVSIPIYGVMSQIDAEKIVNTINTWQE